MLTSADWAALDAEGGRFAHTRCATNRARTLCGMRFAHARCTAQPALYGRRFAHSPYTAHLGHFAEGASRSSLYSAHLHLPMDDHGRTQIHSA